MEDLCTACLCSGRNLYSIRETGFNHLYSQILNEVQVCDTPELSVRVCWECRALLRRLQLFKQQVKRSYTELMEYAQNSTKLPQPATTRLQISQVHNYVYPEIDIKIEMDDTQFLDYEMEMKAEETHCEPETFVNDLDVEPRRETRKNDKVSYAKRPNSGQLECLVGFLEINPNIARGLLRTYTGKVETKRKWDKIATRLNSLGGVKKDGRGWAKYWAEKKFAIKKQLAQLSDATTASGGIPEGLPALDKRFLAVMSGQCLQTGEPSQPANPLPEQPIKEKAKKKMKQAEKTPIKKRIKVKKKEPVPLEISEDDINADVTDAGDIEKKIEGEKEKVADKEVSCKETTRVNGTVKAVKEVLPERPQCAECGKHFSSRKTYKYHLNVLHKGQNRYPCPRCGKVYQWKSNLGRHLRSHKARDSGELYCETCDKRFASVATYRQHLRVSRRHVPESEFSFMCNECGKKFVNKTRLRDHIDWEHLKKIKFRCQLCNKPFKCHTSLYVHMQNVHKNKEKKDNLCHVCGKSYQNAAKLKYHIVAMHTSETPYQCSQCNAAFGWYSSLYRHVREVHYKMKVQPKKSKKSKKSEVLPSLLPPQVVLAQMNQAGPP